MNGQHCKCWKKRKDGLQIYMNFQILVFFFFFFFLIKELFWYMASNDYLLFLFIFEVTKHQLWTCWRGTDSAGVETDVKLSLFDDDSVATPVFSFNKHRGLENRFQCSLQIWFFLSSFLIDPIKCYHPHILWKLSSTCVMQYKNSTTLQHVFIKGYQITADGILKRFFNPIKSIQVKITQPSFF